VTAPAPELGTLAERVMFRVDGRNYTVADVCDAALADGAWEATAASAVDGAAEVSAAELEQAELRFRRARRLMSADELTRWLEGWGLSVGEWRDFLRREVRIERDGTDDGPAHDATPADQRSVLVEAICSGALMRWAHELAEKLAVWRGSGEAVPELPAGLTELDRAVVGFRERAAGDTRRLERELASSFLDWTRFNLESVSDAREDVLREISACVRVDRRTLAEVAAQAGLELDQRVLWLGECAHATREALLGAREGDLIGPLPLDERASIVSVLERISPTLEDPDVVDRARDRVTTWASRRMLDEWVVFDGLS
jgi:hypothetical protein